MNSLKEVAITALRSRYKSDGRFARLRGPIGQRPSSVAGKRDGRLCQLLHLARSGDGDAAGDLWREFGFRFEEDAP